MDEIVKALPRKEGIRITFIILITSVGMVLSGAAAYGTLIKQQEVAIDSRVRPIKVRIYEQEAVIEHIFDRIESQRPPSKRRRLEDVKHEGRLRFREDEDGGRKGDP